MEQVYTPKQDYKVLVRCFTYNQSKYIEDALNGFAMQQTNFPFVCLVVDDCSTDGEQDVIKAWMERECDMDKAEYIEIELANIILVPHRSNANCTFAFNLLKQNLYKQKEVKAKLISPWREHCEYEALCEGDDYWTHPEKLHKQVGYLENHFDYTAVCANAIELTPEGADISVDRVNSKGRDCDITPEMMIAGGGGFVATPGLLYRLKTLENYPEFTKKCIVGDYPLQIHLSIQGRVRYFIKKMACYRVSAQGSWSNNFHKKSIGDLIKARKNIFAMLDDFDKMSNYKYHSAFAESQSNALYWAMQGRPDDWKKLSSEFSNVIAYFRGWRKVENYLRINDLTFVYQLLRPFISLTKRISK